MTPGERNAAIETLRRAATSAIDAMEANAKGSPGRFRKAIKIIEDTWRNFPECKGEPAPSPEAIMRMIERFDREAAEDRQFAEALKR